MRLSLRKCVTLVAAFMTAASLFFYAFQSRGAKVSSHFEFLGHALPHTGGRFHESHDDGTGGWLTRWFKTPSRAPFLGNTPYQSTGNHRCPVYTYIDTTVHRRGSEEFAIIRVWMRSFWALGFKPIVLTDKDARKHPRFSLFRNQGLIGGSKSTDLGKWLAMAQRGGLFVDYRSIPMPTQANRYFANFRQCDFGQLTLYKSTGEQLLHGTQDAYEQLIQYIIENPEGFDSVSEHQPLFNVMRTQFNVEPSLEGIATYSAAAIAELFPTLKSELLPSLINAHLHEHFLQEHPVLAIVDPIEGSRLNLFRQQLTLLANSIAICPSSPIVGSCPPHLSRCKPCKGISVVPFRSLAKVPHDAYVLATVPHPYTFLSYVNQKSNLDPRFVRNTRRDNWVISVTSETVDKGTGGFQRIQALKKFVEADATVAFDSDIPHGIWQTWEEVDLEGVQSSLGFQLEVSQQGNEGASRGHDSSSIPYTARDHVLSHSTENSRDMVESWNLAWAELWYFIRALQRRRKSEQLDVLSSFGF